MKKICAWCGTWLVKDGEEDIRKTDTVISHGICKQCLKTVHFQAGVKLQELLDHLDVPVVAVDSDVVLKVVNEKWTEIEASKEAVRMDSLFLLAVFGVRFPLVRIRDDVIMSTS